MGKSKQLLRTPKKQKAKAESPETADEFQEAADREEEAGGKHRAGDPAKSGRAFVRALDIYERGISTYPANFDLAYNKARLQLEVTQHAAVVDHIGLPLVDLLVQTLVSHRYALSLDEENADLLFNTSQVLTSLAEQLSESGRSHEAVPLLQESLELLSACLSRQEMVMEQQQTDLEDVDDGGVFLDPEERSASASCSDISAQTALIESPVTASDLLDTVHASLSSMTTLVPLVEKTALEILGGMAHALTEKRAPQYVSLLPADLEDTARFTVGLDRAIFVAVFADAQYSFVAIDLETYLDQLNAFDFSGKDQSAHALSSEGEARTELALSVLDRFQSSPDVPANTCWKQLTFAQELYSKAIKIDSEDTEERKAGIYQLKGDVELIRHRIASIPESALSESIKQSASTLIQNAQTYFKGAAQLARVAGDTELETKAKRMWLVATDISALLYDVETKEAPFEGNSITTREDLIHALEEVVGRGLIEMALAEKIIRRIRR